MSFRDFMYKIFFIIIFVLSLFFSNALFAQGYMTFRSEQENIRNHSKLRLGPFRFAPSLSRMSFGYDSNVYQTSSQQDPIADWSVSIGPELILYLPLGDWIIFSIRENPGYVYHAEQKNLQGWTNSISPAIPFSMTPISLDTSKMAPSGHKREQAPQP